MLRAGTAESSQWPSAWPHGEENSIEAGALMPTQQNYRG